MTTSTTYDALRASIVTTIRDILPSYVPSQSERWCIVHAQEDVPSDAVRNYFVDLAIPTPTGLVYGGCMQHEAELRIVTSYGGRGPAEAKTIAARDSQDLWRELHRPVLDGSPIFTGEGFEPESEDGHLWGSHVFSVAFFLPLET